MFEVGRECPAQARDRTDGWLCGAEKGLLGQDPHAALTTLLWRDERADACSCTPRIIVQQSIMH